MALVRDGDNGFILPLDTCLLFDVRFLKSTQLLSQGIWGEHMALSPQMVSLLMLQDIVRFDLRWPYGFVLKKCLTRERETMGLYRPKSLRV